MLLLLDFDGVVLKKCAAHETVANRCRMYARRYLGDNVSDRWCDELYRQRGHTVRGLQWLGHKSCSKAEFNDYVYKYFDASYFRDLKTMEHQRHIAQLFKLLNKCQGHGHQVRLFTNAPVSWTRVALTAMDPRGDLEAVLGHTNIVTDTDNILKPDDEAYAAYARLNTVFVDDNFTNFVPVIDNTQWKKVWLCEGESAMRMNSHLHIAGCLDHLME